MYQQNKTSVLAIGILHCIIHHYYYPPLPVSPPIAASSSLSSAPSNSSSGATETVKPDARNFCEYSSISFLLATATVAAPERCTSSVTWYARGPGHRGQYCRQEKKVEAVTSHTRHTSTVRDKCTNATRHNDKERKQVKYLINKTSKQNICTFEIISHTCCIVCTVSSCRIRRQSFSISSLSEGLLTVFCAKQYA
jgi:hypothetical protein